MELKAQLFYIHDAFKDKRCLTEIEESVPTFLLWYLQPPCQTLVIFRLFQFKKQWEAGMCKAKHQAEASSLFTIMLLRFT